MVDCRTAVLSDEYKGFAFASRRGEDRLLSFLRADCVRRVSPNLTFAYFYYPLDTQSGSEYPFSLMQNCYGLLSEQELLVSGVLNLRDSAFTSLYGQGTLIGFLDTGINYAASDFLEADGTTRVERLWDQTITDETLPPMEGKAFYGTVFSREQLNASLESGVLLSSDEVGHGSAMAAAAAGSRTESNLYGGAAPAASLLVVKLRQAKPYLRRFYRIPENAQCFSEEDIIYGVEWMISTAEELSRPLVICICLGSNQGNHAGESVLARYLNEVARIPGICVATAAGNEVGRGHHFFGQASTDNPVTVELLVGEGEDGFAAELWALEPDLFTIEIASPAGEVIPRIQGSTTFTRSYPFPLEGGTVDIQSNLYDRVYGLQGIFIRFTGVAAGLWRIRVFREGDFSGAFHMWLPMQEFLTSGTRFLRPDPYVTICDPGTAEEVITFTAYSVRTNALYLTASYGYTPYGIIKPDLAAPQGEGEFIGTGKAAAFGAGCAALFFEDVGGEEGFRELGTPEIKRAMLATAARDAQKYPNREWGFGRLSAYSAILSRRARV